MSRLNKELFLILIAFVFVRCMENIKDLDTDLKPVSHSEKEALASDVFLNEDTIQIRQGKYIYLTIDDAPLNGSGYIDSIISVEKIKANLFLVGNPINGSSRFKSYYEKLRNNSYIEIYNHSYSHASNRYTEFYKNPEKVLADFEINQADFDILHKIARLPGRNLWQLGERKKNYAQTGASSAELLANNGYKIFGWDVEWYYNADDYTPKQNIDELVDEIERLYNSSRTFTPNHVVLLMHDQMFKKVDKNNNLSELITKLKEFGYKFEYLSLYPELLSQ